MTGVGRKFGVVGFLLVVGLACTQLLDDQPNTLAPISTPRVPTQLPMYQLPGSAGVPQCTTGETRCEGALLQTCADDRTGWVTVQRCAAAALCQSDPASCREASCGVDEMTCSGSVLQKCNADRTGWELFDTCLSPAHCNADLRQCMTEACNPGDRRCDRSELDQSPVLEACNDARQDWAPLDACVTRELCDQTLTTAFSGGGLVLGSDGMVLPAPASPSGVVRCNLPACSSGEVRCEGSRLEVCAEGLTGWRLVEECASEALCSGSLANVNATGAPQCLPPACAVGQHGCTAAGVLQVCSEDRTGFRTIQECIGPAFCNAVLADQGQEGCRSAACQPGEMQCNGAQIQICRQDRMGLDNTGVPCESAALCNADDPFNAFCEEPVCRRGGTSGNEFRCDGAQLERCNESLTNYDPLATCVNEALCDASQRANGCRPALCQPGERRCTDAGLLQTCNGDQTDFVDTENCGARNQCDDEAGRCSDPCEPGTVRCNAQSGDLQECRDRLTGWQTIGDCVSAQLCDAANRRCNPPVCQPGERRCETRNGAPVIMECAAGRNAFAVARTCAAGQICDAQNNECDVCAPNASSCDGDTLVRCDTRGQTQTRQNPCGPGLCSAARGRCLVCNPINSARCVDLQLRVCAQGQGDNEFERSENCDTPQLCNQTLTSCGRGLNGQSCQCNDGVCSPNQLRCQNGQIQRCNAGLTGFDTVQQCANGCNPGSTVCNECNPNTPPQCINGQVRRCVNGFFQNDNCNGLGCNPDSDQCNECSANANPPVCQANGQVRRCVSGFFQNDNCSGLGCSAASNNSCNECAPNTAVCQNNQRRVCVAGRFQNDNCNGNGCSTANNNACNECSSANNPPLCQANGQVRTCVAGRFQNDPCIVNSVSVRCNPNTNQCNGCAGTAAVCENNQLRTCVNGQLQNDDCNGLGCNPDRDQCNDCTVANNPPQCQGNVQLRRCVDGRFQNDPCVDANNTSVGCSNNACNQCANNSTRCTNNNAAVQRCVGGQFGPATACSDNQVCNGNEACANNACNDPPNATAGTACGTGLECNGNGACVPDVECDATRPCPPGTSCDNGECVECEVDDDCDDANGCTQDFCFGGACDNPLRANCTRCNFTGSLCQADGTLGTCTDGRLTTAPCGGLGCFTSRTSCNVCRPTSLGCTNNRQQLQCLGNGSGFVPNDLCVSPNGTFPAGAAATCTTMAGLITHRLDPCDDNDACTDDSCVPEAIGCLHRQNGGLGCLCNNSTVLCAGSALCNSINPGTGFGICTITR